MSFRNRFREWWHQRVVLVLAYLGILDLGDHDDDYLREPPAPKTESQRRRRVLFEAGLTYYVTIVLHNLILLAVALLFNLFPR